MSSLFASSALGYKVYFYLLSLVMLRPTVCIFTTLYRIFTLNKWDLYKRFMKNLFSLVNICEFIKAFKVTCWEIFFLRHYLCTTYFSVKFHQRTRHTGVKHLFIIAPPSQFSIRVLNNNFPRFFEGWNIS